MPVTNQLAVASAVPLSTTTRRRPNARGVAALTGTVTKPSIFCQVLTASGFAKCYGCQVLDVCTVSTAFCAIVSEALKLSRM
jgi:hypothetical protein